MAGATPGAARGAGADAAASEVLGRDMAVGTAVRTRGVGSWCICGGRCSRSGHHCPADIARRGEPKSRRRGVGS